MTLIVPLCLWMFAERASYRCADARCAAFCFSACYSIHNADRFTDEGSPSTYKASPDKQHILIASLECSFSHVFQALASRANQTGITNRRHNWSLIRLNRRGTSAASRPPVRLQVAALHSLSLSTGQPARPFRCFEASLGFAAGVIGPHQVDDPILLDALATALRRI